DDDPALTGLAERGGQRLRVVGDDDHGVDVLGDEVLDDLHLLGGILGVGADLPGVDLVAEVGVELVDAVGHGLEPGDAVDLRDGGDLVGAVTLGTGRVRCRSAALTGGSAGGQDADGADRGDATDRRSDANLHGVLL